MKSNSNLSILEREYKANIWKSYFFQFFRGLHLFSGVLVPFFTMWGGITFTQVMLLQAVYTFAIFALEIPTGAIADRFGRKTSLILGGLVTALGAIIYTSHANFLIFILAEILFALGASLFSGADHALVYDSLKQINKESSSKKVFSKLASLNLIAIAIAAPLGSFIAGFTNLRIPMLLTAVPMLISVAIALSFKEPEIERKTQRENYLQTIKNGIKYFKENKEVRILTFDYVPIVALAFFLIWAYQLVLTKFEVSIALFGLVHTGITIAEIIVLNNFKFLEKTFQGKRNYLFFSSFLIGGAFLLIGFTNNLYLALLGIALASGFGLTRKPLYKSYLNKFIESEHRATVLSTVSMIYNLVSVITNLIFGRLAEWNLDLALIIIGILILAFAAFSKLEEEHLRD